MHPRALHGRKTPGYETDYSHEEPCLDKKNPAALRCNFPAFSLRVSLDMGKVVYSWMISRDKEMPGTVVRSSTIPEELGRVAYLLTDKTGTLTQNEMVCTNIHLLPFTKGPSFVILIRMFSICRKLFKRC